MITLNVVCPSCGQCMRRMIDEECPPASLRCRCGARLMLNVGAEPNRPVPDVEDADSFGECEPSVAARMT